jgi:hypothetical protein
MRVTVLSAVEARERNQRFRASGLSRSAFERAEMERTGTTVFVWWEDEEGRYDAFTYCCPACAGLCYGQLGEQPVSGWDRPRWVNTGTRERPTLTPSLGCGCWRRGEGDGHWWLRDGELVPA